MEPKLTLRQTTSWTLKQKETIVIAPGLLHD